MWWIQFTVCSLTPLGVWVSPWRVIPLRVVKVLVHRRFRTQLALNPMHTHSWVCLTLRVPAAEAAMWSKYEDGRFWKGIGCHFWDDWAESNRLLKAAVRISLRHSTDEAEKRPPLPGTGTAPSTIQRGPHCRNQWFSLTPLGRQRQVGVCLFLSQASA